MKAVLRVVKERLGDPSGITYDMRSGIISAAQSMFPKTPIRICLMHFLRDLGKDLLLIQLRSDNMSMEKGVTTQRKKGADEEGNGDVD